MKKIAYLFTLFALFTACNSGNKESGNNQHQAIDTTSTEIVIEKHTDIDYTQCPLTYLIQGELFFHSVAENQAVKFEEETEPIFNFTFDDKGEILYYSVARDSMLWLKSADINQPEVAPQWLTNLELTKEDCTTETYGQATPLYYNNGALLLCHNFNWNYYDFESMAIYSIANNSIVHKEYDYHLIQKASGELSSDKFEQYFKVVDGQLYYSHHDADVCLSDHLDFNSLKSNEEEDFWVETTFTSFLLSPDKTKILFGAIIEMGDLGHGPYCIANSDGSNQMILTQTDISSNKKPMWLKNNSVAFIDFENNLSVANNEDNSIQIVAQDVTDYKAR